jgi:hypothetical protein
MVDAGTSLVGCAKDRADRNANRSTSEGNPLFSGCLGTGVEVLS